MRRRSLFLAACALGLLGITALGARAEDDAPADALRLPPLPGGDERFVVQPEFRDADLLLLDLRSFAVPSLVADLVAPRVETIRDGKVVSFLGRIALQGPAARVTEARRLLALIDAPRPAVEVSILAAETLVEGEMGSGGHLLFDRDAAADSSDGIFRGIQGDFEPDQWLRSTLSGARPFQGTSLRFARFDPGDAEFEYVLRMLARRGEAEFLAWPRLVLTEGEPGSLTSVVALPQVILDPSRPEASATLIVAPAEETGLRLGATAVRVGADSAVLDLNVWVRVAQPSTAANSAPGTLVLRERRVTTRVTVHDRESLLLGGLRLFRRLADRRAYPLLGEVPALGSLLSSRSKAAEQTEILFLVSCRIVKPGGT